MCSGMFSFSWGSRLGLCLNMWMFILDCLCIFVRTSVSLCVWCLTLYDDVSFRSFRSFRASYFLYNTHRHTLMYVYIIILRQSNSKLEPYQTRNTTRKFQTSWSLEISKQTAMPWSERSLKRRSKNVKLNNWRVRKTIKNSAFIVWLEFSVPSHSFCRG